MNEYRLITDKIDEVNKELVNLSLSLHEHPELSFKEYYACETICELLENYGFTITKNIAGMETAFIAEYKGKSDGPTVAFLAEYDALPIGHACGHNLIATMSVGAAIGIKEVMDNLGGKILVVGTPAEEGGGGKVIMCENGVFDNVDFAMMIHPHKRNLIMRGGLAVKHLNVEFFGKLAHSTRPEEGINALSAAIHTFNFIDAKRALLPLKANVSGIIIDGGKASNVIPEYSSCEFCVRGDTVKDLNIVEREVEKAIETANCLFGTTSKVTKAIMYTERYPNKYMDEKFKSHLESFGEEVNYPPANMKYGSSDIGNVSLQVPTIQPYLKITECDTHTHEFTEATKSERAQIQMIKGAKSLALTACDILSDSELRKNIVKEFKEKVPSYTRNELGYK